MRPASVKGPRGRSRPKTHTPILNWESSDVPGRIKHQVVISEEQIGNFQIKQISKGVTEGLSKRTNLTNFEDDNNDEREEEIMIEEGLNIPDDIREHIEGMQLMSEMRESGVLLNSMIRSIRHLRDYLGTTDQVKAYKEGDERDAFQKNKIEVKLDLEGSVENLEEWKRKRKEIKEIVRNTKDDDIMIYTFVDRKRN